jgi:hypothetical protein
MKRLIALFLLSLFIVTAFYNVGAQSVSPQVAEALQGLLTGDETIDAALEDAYLRGVQSGREESKQALAECQGKLKK